MQHGNLEQINYICKLWAHVQLIIHTQFQWAERFTRIVSGNICGEGRLNIPIFFFCYPIIWISQMQVYLSSIVQKQEGAKKKKKRKRRNRIIAQIKIAFNTFIHVFLRF